MKNVIYIVKSELHVYPPCVTQIRLLKQCGVNVSVLCGSCDTVVTKIFESEKIPYLLLKDPRGKYKGRLDKINNYLTFRHSLKKELRRRDLSNTILWFGNAETLLSMKGVLNNYKYAVSFLELLDDHPFRMRLLKKLANDSVFNLSCEETRSYIMKAWWKLKKLPYLMPNKPFDSPTRFRNVTHPEAQKILDGLDGKKIILYQGLIKNKDILENFAKAVESIGGDYVLLLMGSDRENIIPDIKKISDKVYSGWVTAPDHLQITSHAYIGVLFYDGDYCLNNAFCAPNKIYEYSAFGIPMIANNIPGLSNTVGNCGAAVCSDLSVESIVMSIKQITENYLEMQTASSRFFSAIDMTGIMNRIIRENLE